VGFQALVRSVFQIIFEHTDRMSGTSANHERIERTNDHERTNDQPETRRCQRCRFDLVLSLFPDEESPICRECTAKEDRR
jgi:hypothetical protein